MFRKYKYFETFAHNLFYQKKLQFFLICIELTLHNIIWKNAKNSELFFM